MSIFPSLKWSCRSRWIKWTADHRQLTTDILFLKSQIFFFSSLLSRGIHSPSHLSLLSQLLIIKQVWIFPARKMLSVVFDPSSVVRRQSSFKSSFFAFPLYKEPDSWLRMLLFPGYNNHSAQAYWEAHVRRLFFVIPHLRCRWLEETQRSRQRELLLLLAPWQTDFLCASPLLLPAPGSLI